MKTASTYAAAGMCPLALNIGMEVVVVTDAPFAALVTAFQLPDLASVTAKLGENGTA